MRISVKVHYSPESCPEYRFDLQYFMVTVEAPSMHASVLVVLASCVLYRHAKHPTFSNNFVLFRHMRLKFEVKVQIKHFRKLGSTEQSAITFAIWGLCCYYERTLRN